MAVDIQWANFGLVSGGGGWANALKRDPSGADFTLAPDAYAAPFLDSLNPGGLASMDVVVPPGGAIKIQMYSSGSAQVVAPTTLGGGTYSGSQLTMTASGTPTWDIPPGRALRCYCVSTTGGTFHLSPLRLASAPVGTPYWWGPATLGGTASLPSPDTADPRGFWSLPATSGLTLIGTKAWTGAKTFTVPFYRTGAGTINAKITATTGTATLVTADGATVNGDGSLTIPADTHLFPSWTATDGATLTLTKGAGIGSAFYGPLYLDETVVPPTPPPSIAKIIPTSGPDTGGTLVDVIGTDLTGATAVDFGGTAGTGLTVDPSGNLATVTTPAHTAGPAPVTITTPAGTSAAKTFTFEAPVVVPAPTITSIAPDHGDNTGGTAVIIAGTDLTDMTTVTVDGASVPFTVLSDGALTIVTPAHADGPVGLVVTTTHGTSGPATFTFEAPCIPAPTGPTIAGIIPGEALPGATIQIVGTNLTDATVTMCGETAAIASNTGNIITMAIPPTCPDGPTTITVTTPDGETTADLTVLPVPEPGECPSLTDWCAPDTPCPDCTPCVVAPARPLIAMWADLAARIRCGWPDDRCPPGDVTVEATQQPPGSDCDAEVQVIPGGPAGVDHAGVTTWGGRVVLLRPWAQINEAGQLTDAAHAQRLEAIARSLEDLQIMQQLIGATACGSCGPGGAIIDRVERVTSTTTLGWAFTVRIS